nr:VOC family protein [Mucilaginibacter sp. L294]
MKALSSTVVIHVSDLNRASKYYIDVLGFKPDFEFGDYRGLSYGDICIHLSGPKNPGRKKVPGSAHVCIDCDDITAYYDGILKNGALIDVPIADRVYGVRDFSVNDEDGNTLVFGMAIV